MCKKTSDMKNALPKKARRVKVDKLSCSFVGSSQAASTNVFVRLFTVDLDSYLLHVSPPSMGSSSVRVADSVACHFAFTADSANS